MSHLLLDEIYAVEWKGGRWRFKKSFGTAMKLWGKSAWANISTYGKLIIVGLMILGEPMVMERYGHRYGELSKVVIQRDQWRGGNDAPVTEAMPPGVTLDQYVQNDPRIVGQPHDPNLAPPAWQPNQTLPPTTYEVVQPQQDRTIYDTARRFQQYWNGGSNTNIGPPRTQR